MIRRLFPILGITFIDILGFSMLIPLLPYFVTHFNASPVVVGVLFSTFSFCQLVAGPIWGNLSDRIGRKGVLIISQVGSTIGWAMLGAATSIPFVFAARILEGFSGGNIGVTQAYVADLVEPKERSRAFGLIGATFGAGMIFGPLMESLLFARFGYSAPFYAAAGLQFITLLVTIRYLPESRGKSEEQVGPLEIVRTFQNKKFSPLLWQKLALSLSLYGWFSVMALYLAHQLHFTPANRRIIFLRYLDAERIRERVSRSAASPIGWGIAACLHSAYSRSSSASDCSRSCTRFTSFPIVALLFELWLGAEQQRIDGTHQQRCGRAPARHSVKRDVVARFVLRNYLAADFDGRTRQFWFAMGGRVLVLLCADCVYRRRCARPARR